MDDNGVSGLADLILEVLTRSGRALRAREIAAVVRRETGAIVNRSAVNKYLYGSLRDQVESCPGYAWSVKNQVGTTEPHSRGICDIARVPETNRVSDSCRQALPVAPSHSQKRFSNAEPARVRTAYALRAINEVEQFLVRLTDPAHTQRYRGAPVAPSALLEDRLSQILNGVSWPQHLVEQLAICFIPSQGAVVVDCMLPTPNQMPAIEKVTYDAQHGKLVETWATYSDTARRYDSFVRQVALACMFLLFASDALSFGKVAFNGWISVLAPMLDSIELQRKRSAAMPNRISFHRDVFRVPWPNTAGIPGRMIS